MKREGFTLIELIIVIVILGILAAVAVPKFAGFTKKAKISAVKGFAGNLRAAMNIVHAKWLVNDNTSADNVTLSDGEVVTVCIDNGTTGCPSTLDAPGYPAASSDGILKAINFDNKTFVPTISGATVTFDYSGSTNCWVKYDYSSGYPKVTYDTTGCE